MPMPFGRSRAFRITAAIVVFLVIVIGVVVLVGSTLPVAHVATRSITVPAPPESVYATITDFAAFPSWRTDVRRVEVHPGDGPRRFTEESSNGSLTMQVEEADPPHRLVTRIVGDDLPFGGAWAWSVTPEGTGSRVTVTEHGEVYNAVFRFLSAYLMGHTATLDAYLGALGRKYGIEVTPVDAAPVPL
jgi:uncharacterized protein YndB with AHSA1/START domain